MKSHPVRTLVIAVIVMFMVIGLYGLTSNVSALEEPARVETTVSATTAPTTAATVETAEAETDPTEPGTEPTEIPESTTAPTAAPIKLATTTPKHTHSYDAKATAPTCTEDGYTAYTCKCGDSYVADEVHALGHDYESVVTAPAVGAVGYTTHTCKNCGDEYVDNYTDYQKTEATEPEVTEHVHNYVTQTFAPTCTDDGYTVCTCECGNSYTADEVPALGHDYVTYVVEPTYAEEGYDLHICNGCGDAYKDNFVSVLEQPSSSVEEEDEVVVEEDGFIHSECHCDRNDGHLHEEIRRGNYVYVYCEHVDAPHKSPNGLTVWYPYDWYF